MVGDDVGTFGNGIIGDPDRFMKGIVEGGDEGETSTGTLTTRGGDTGNCDIAGPPTGLAISSSVGDTVGDSLAGATVFAGANTGTFGSGDKGFNPVEPCSVGLTVGSGNGMPSTGTMTSPGGDTGEVLDGDIVIAVLGIPTGDAMGATVGGIRGGRTGMDVGGVNTGDDVGASTGASTGIVEGDSSGTVDGAIIGEVLVAGNACVNLT